MFAAGNDFAVSCKFEVQNIGDISGFETAQCYVGFSEPLSHEPCKTLQGFVKEEIGANELKKLEIVKSRGEREIEKQELKIQKYHRKIEKMKSETFRKRLIIKKQSLEEQKNIMIDKASKLNDEISNLKVIKKELEGEQAKSQLMHKFAHMNLQWERSRQIDLKDIYRS